MKKFFILLIFITLLLPGAFAFSDTFIEDFYFSVNIARESMDLNALERNVKVERIAETYSDILAEEGKIDHEALTDFEFKQLCLNYELPASILHEVLASSPEYFNSYQIFLLFMESPDHKEALLLPEGQYIGAGYTKKNGKLFFTAYVMVEKEK